MSAPCSCGARHWRLDEAHGTATVGATCVNCGARQGGFRLHGDEQDGPWGHADLGKFRRGVTYDPIPCTGCGRSFRGTGGLKRHKCAA